MTSAFRVGAVLLAAGASRRFGDANKLLQQIDGQPLAVRAATTLAAAGLAPVVAVLGTGAAEVRAALATVAGLDLVENPDHAQGMGTSIACGVRRLRDDDSLDGVVIALADMPHLRRETIAALVDAFTLEPEAGIVMPVMAGWRGHPVLFARRYFDELAGLGGDIGARPVLEAHPDAIIEVETDDPGIFLDVDTPEDLGADLDARG